MNVSLLGTIRRFVHAQLANAPSIVRLSGLESLSVNQVEPERYELSRSGRRFLGGNQVIAEGIAPVAAIPTTTATLALYNGDPARNLVIERLGIWLGSGTAAAGLTLFATVSTNVIASPPTAHATGYGAINANGGSRSSRALWTTALTLPNAPTANWVQVLSSFQLAAANVGQGDIAADLKGMLVVPPQHALGLAVLSGAGTTPLYGISAVWSEIEGETE